MNTNFISKYHIGTLWRIRLINTLLNLEKIDVLLDAGCGEGYTSYVVSKKVKKVIGVDISKETIDFNNKFSNKKLSFQVVDLNNLSKSFYSKFDKIICMDVLEHANGFPNIINNFSKALKKEGVFLVTIPVFDDHGHFEHNDFDYLKKLFRKKGFKIDTLEYIQMPFFTKKVHQLINVLRKLLGQKMKEVDSFDETLSFELRKKETLTFRLYKIFFNSFPNNKSRF